VISLRYHCTFFEELGEITNDLNQDILLPDRDKNPRPPKYAHSCQYLADRRICFVLISGDRLY
jgi:hypothetical protein